ncbi:uncharacterized protein VTP21DRAFT_3763 [Calcarisporiella thermophila]|uniref:uncharacterized protein n=1 Tax=Calcarisporiella thermophila TaxID=911321 RepID=UPI0037425206
MSGNRRALGFMTNETSSIANMDENGFWRISTQAEYTSRQTYKSTERRRAQTSTRAELRWGSATGERSIAHRASRSNIPSTLDVLGLLMSQNK